MFACTRCGCSGSGQIPFVAGAPLAAEGDGVYAGTVKTGVQNCIAQLRLVDSRQPLSCAAGAIMFLACMSNSRIDRCLQDCTIQQVLDVL